MSTTRYGWSDFEEDESTDEIPGKFVLSIGRLDDRGHLGHRPPRFRRLPQSTETWRTRNARAPR